MNPNAVKCCDHDTHTCARFLSEFFLLVNAFIYISHCEVHAKQNKEEAKSGMLV